MVKSVYPVNKELHSYGGHFLVGEYSPARRSPSLPVIPARASAHPEAVVKARPRYLRWTSDLGQEDITRLPTVPQSGTLWQFETPRYAAESSLASLTLAITDTNLVAWPASPGAATIQTGKGPQSPREDYDPIVARLYEHHVDDIDTVPPLLSSPLAQRRPWIPFLHPVESMRWWLIQPGRLEFLIWLCGTILLIGLTVVFVLFVLSSFGYLSFH